MPFNLVQDRPDVFFVGTGTNFANNFQEVVPPFHLDLLTTPSGVVATFELFAGSANLTHHMLLRHFDAFAFDYSRNKQQLKAPCASVDLSTESGQSFILDLYTKYFVLVTSLAPPCGTASRAREIPMKNQYNQPKPLRSSEFPLGLPDLSEEDGVRVSKANVLYFFSVALCFFLMANRRFFLLENPTNSYFWEIPAVQELLNHPSVFVADFQACAWGSKRPKWTRIIANHPAILRLCACCPKDHQHLPWGMSNKNGQTVFATAEEAAYPNLLCAEIADIAVSMAADAGLVQGLKIDRDAPVIITDKGAVIASGIQPRRTLELSLVSEFKSIQELMVPPGLVAKVSESFPGAAASRVLRLFSKGGDVAAEEIHAIVGFYRSPVEFMEESLKCAHPADLLNGLPDELGMAIFDHLVLGPTAIKKKRLLFLKHVLELSISLKEADARLAESFSAERRKVLAEKKFAVLKALLQENNYTDVSIVDDMVEGIEHIGVHKKSGVFKDGGKIPLISKADLLNSSKVVNASLMQKIINSPADPTTDRALWDATMMETQNGWLQGPFTFEQTSAMFPGGFCISRRFGIVQSEKLRSIDDLSESNVNNAYGSPEKLSLLGTDAVCATVRTFLEAAKKDGSVKIALDSGKTLVGTLHSEWLPLDISNLVGKTLDLHKAYRQMTCKDSQRWASVVGLRNPDTQEVALFPAVSMLFGGSAAVMSFNRAARCLWFLMVKCLNVLSCNFFDDFPIIEHASLASSTARALEVFFKTLGWKYSDDPEKDKPFSKEFTLLGVVLRLSDVPCVFNKPSRVVQICEMIDNTLSKGRMSVAEASCLRGRLQFASGQIFGKIAGRALQLIGEVVYGSRQHSVLSNELKATLLWLKHVLTTATPRPVRLPEICLPVVVFTDAAIDNSVGMCAGVLIDRHFDLKMFFSVQIPTQLLANWKSEGAEVVIHHAEILPVFLVCYYWKNHLACRRVLFFVDNQSSKFALIKGYSSVPKATAVIRALNEIMFASHAIPWYAWVPTHSNIADAPSRNDFKFLMDNGFSKSEVFVPDSFEDWEKFTSPK